MNLVSLIFVIKRLANDWTDSCKSVMQVEEVHITNSLRCSIAERDLKSHIAGLLREWLAKNLQERLFRKERSLQSEMCVKRVETEVD